MQKQITISRWIFLAISVFVLAACSGGSGQEVTQNAPPEVEEGGGGIVYNGPLASTDDVENFKLNVWDNLAETNRCGECHVQGNQSPMFVRNDDINLAYSEANALVDLASPSLSRLVTKVGEGHNCWAAEVNVCVEIITNYIEGWANASGVEANEIVLTAPPEYEVGVSKNFPADATDFGDTVYPLLTQYCANCHSEDSDVQQQPFFASADLDVAYQAAKPRMDLATPASSRLVVRLGSEFHNCWTDCTTSANAMRDAIQAFSDRIPLTEVDEDLVISRALGLPDGIVASSGGRFETNAIALYEFKTGSGSTAFDTSGVDPAMDLNITGNVEWVGSWGIRINDGKAQAPTSASEKLHSLITSTGEYSLEAWVVPGNVVQDGPARIVTYSGGDDARNFTLGQTTYDYNFLTRSSVSDPNGMPMLSTPSADEVLQSTLQHVVANFDPVNGRTIYVNGELVANDPEVQGNLNDWDSTFAFAVGNEVDNQQLWMGTVRLLAIHNRVLTEDQILGNFETGVGEKFFLLFGVSHLIDMPQAYIVFEVQQFDNYAYLFNTPFFISLDETAAIPSGLTIEGLRIGLNGREVETGQTYANLDITITDQNYVAGSGTPLSSLGALVPLDQGPDTDQFFLTFDRIGSTEYDRPAEAVPDLVPPVPADEQSDIGVRTFDEVNATLSALSTVPMTNAAVVDTFATVRQQLPTVESATAFLSSHQSGVMQLSVTYCTSLVGDSGLRSAFFPGFDFSASYGAVFGGTGRDIVIDSLMEALLAHDIDIGSGTFASLESSPEPVDLEIELSELIDDMSASDTPTTVIATCAAAFGSALMLVQ